MGWILYDARERPGDAPSLKRVPTWAGPRTISCAVFLRCFCRFFFLLRFFASSFSLFCPVFCCFVRVFLFFCSVSFSVFFFLFWYYIKCSPCITRNFIVSRKMFIVYYENCSTLHIKMFVVYYKNVHRILWNCSTLFTKCSMHIRQLFSTYIYIFQKCSPYIKKCWSGIF